MLTKNEIRKAIINRLEAAQGQCNSHYMNHFDGVLRGLLWALNGEDPGAHLSDEGSVHILELAKIPWRYNTKTEIVHYDNGSSKWGEFVKKFDEENK